MEQRGFDHDDVYACLRNGTAHEPEPHGRSHELRANVVHANLHIRVAIGGLDECGGDWSKLRSVTVVTVMGYN